MVQQCNTALATLRDAGKFSQTLMPFAQMKKSVTLFDKITPARAKVHFSSRGGGNYNGLSTADPPPPPAICSVDLVLDPSKSLLVTYSTLKLRAASLSKRRVSLQL